MYMSLNSQLTKEFYLIAPLSQGHFSSLRCTQKLLNVSFFLFCLYSLALVTQLHSDASHLTILKMSNNILIQSLQTSSDWISIYLGNIKSSLCAYPLSHHNSYTHIKYNINFNLNSLPKHKNL